MANKIIAIQISLPSSVKSPINTGDRRTTAVNLAKQIRAGLTAGLDPALSGAGAYLQVQETLVAASATCTTASVVNGNTLTIGGQALTATQKRATGTITCVTALAAQTITINGQVFTAVAGAATLGDATFSIDTGDTETAASIVAQVNAYAGPLVAGLVKARSAAGVVTLYAVTQGTAGNDLTLASSDGGTLAVSGATLANGAAIANNQFDFAGTDATTANAIAAAINASTTAAVKQVLATSDGVSVVTITSKVAGLAGNTITLTSSGATLTVTGSGFLASGSAGAVTRWP